VLKKLSVIGLFVGTLAWWLWPNSPVDEATSASAAAYSKKAPDSDSKGPLSSAIEAINIVDLPENIEDDDVGFRERVEAKRQFDKATEYILKQQWAEATLILQALVEKHPLAIEPYINLAVVYAKTDRLEDARLILKQGVTANPNYAILFDNLQAIHGAQAANAYRIALSESDLGNTDVVNQQVVDMQIINAISMDRVDIDRQRRLRKQIRALLVEQNKIQSNQKRLLAELTDERTELEKSLADANQQVAALDSKYQLEIASLEQQLRQASALALVAETDTTQTDANLAATEPVGLDEPAAQAETPDSQPVVASLTKRADQPAVVDQRERRKRQRAQATNLVRNWATAWSNQSVADYIAYYADDYRPRKGNLNHKQWLEQRRIRLTNKKFIQVAVRDFSIEEATDKFVVTFSQHYRSNTLDDTIRKQLVFAKAGEDWSDSKIVDERVVSN